MNRIEITASDKQILRQLAGHVAHLAARPIEQEKCDLWYRHNALGTTRPLIFCDPENGWNEIITPDSLGCEGVLAREWESRLRKEIFWGEKMGDDRVVAPNFKVAHVWRESNWGLDTVRIGGEDGGAYTWDAPLKNYAVFEKLRFPQITIDSQATQRHLELAEEIFGDLLAVQFRTEWFWTLGLTWTLINLRGMEQVMFDMMDEPDNLHRLMAFLRDANMARLDYLEQNNLLSLNNDDTYVGSGGFGWSHELPGADFDGIVKCRHLWGFAESQETVGISPDMFAEFVLPYQLPLLERFGLNCYGCCEPLDKRWHLVQQIPRLRRVSVSPWADRKKMAEYLEDHYIYSMKPHPIMVAGPAFDEDTIRSQLRHDLQITRECCVEVILKDTHTIEHDPRRVIRWVQIAREEAEAL